MAEQQKKDQHTYSRLISLVIFVVLIIFGTLLISRLRKENAKEVSEAKKAVPEAEIKLELRRNSPYLLMPGWQGDRTGPVDGNMVFPGEKKKTTHSPVQVLHLAERDMDDGDFAGAEDKLRTALVFHGRNVKLYALLGKVLYLQEKYKEAEECFRQQAYLDPEDTVSLNNLSTALAKQKKYNEAIGTLRQLLKSEPRSSSALINLAGMYAVSGDKKNALFYFRQAYTVLGHRILLFAENRSFVSLRQEKEFIDVLESAKREFLKDRKADRKEKEMKKDTQR